MIHVIPKNDWVNHVPHRGCICRPEVKTNGVVVHDAADGRVKYEHQFNAGIKGKEWEVVEN